MPVISPYSLLTLSLLLHRDISDEALRLLLDIKADIFWTDDHVYSIYERAHSEKLATVLAAKPIIASMHTSFMKKLEELESELIAGGADEEDLARIDTIRSYIQD